MTDLRRCPRCGEPNGLIYCPSCHGPRPDAPAPVVFLPRADVVRALDLMEAKAA